MSIRVKSGGSYADVQGVFVKQNGVYGAASVFAKVAGAYVEVSGGGFPPKDFYFTDFAGVVDGTLLRNVPQWDAYNSTGSTSNVRNDFVVTSEQIAKVGGDDFTTSPGLFVWGVNAGSTDNIIRIKISTFPTGGRRFLLVAGAQHNQACAMLEGSATDFLIAINNAGTRTQRFSVAQTNVLGRAVQSGDELAFWVSGDRAYASVNGVSITGATGVDVSGYTKGNIAGIGVFDTRTTIRYDDVYVAAVSNLTNLSVNTLPVFVPGKIGEERQFAISGTFTGDVQGIEYQIVDYPSGTPTTPWRRLGAESMGSGVWSGTVSAPLNSIATNPRSFVNVRAANDTDIRRSSSVFAVGLAVAHYGQSNSQLRAVGAITGYSTANRPYWSGVSGVWNTPAGATTERAEGLASSLLSTATGIPCGVFIYGVSSQSIDELIDTWFDDLQAGLVAANAAGYVYHWTWTQGEAEGDAWATLGIGTRPAAYKARFDELCGLLRAQSASASTPVDIAIIGRRNTTATTALDEAWSAVRAMLFELQDRANVTISHSFLGIPMSDEFHYTNVGYREANRRAAQTAAQSLGYSTYNGRGPIITGATRSGTAITLTVNLNGAESISGTGLTNYEASTDGFATTVAISSVAVSGGNIVVTLSADPGAPVSVRSFYGVNYGASPTLAIGTYADSTTIPVEPLFVPVTSN